LAIVTVKLEGTVAASPPISNAYCVRNKNNYKKSAFYFVRLRVRVEVRVRVRVRLRLRLGLGLGLG
jgi:hypothetical protein